MLTKNFLGAFPFKSPFCSLHSFVFGFSPHENYLLSGQPRQVGLISTIEVSDIDELKKRIASLSDTERQDLRAAGIDNLAIFVREVNGRGLVFTYFVYAHKDYRNAADLLLKHSPAVANMSSLLIRHPRAKNGQVWMNMEWINCIGTEALYPYPKDVKCVQKMGLVGALIPEKEVDYRMLHQSNWPGNTECMVECNYRNWTTFMIELGEELFLFSYSEYVGDDIEADNQRMGENPVTQRWWKHSKDCLLDLIGEGCWSQMWGGKKEYRD